MARRAASIWRAVSRPRPMAFRPYSPKLTLLPTVATPLLRPFCSLRYFLLAGCNIFRSCATRPFRGFRGRAGRHGRLGAMGEHLALEHPYLDADHAVGGARFREPVVDVGPQRVKWHAPFAVPLRARDFNAIQAAR